MKTKDFEKAIASLGVQGLDVRRFSYGINGQVAAVYARKDEHTYLKWDYAGRGFRYDIDGRPDEVQGMEVQGYDVTGYVRDTAFDLIFD